VTGAPNLLLHAIAFVETEMSSQATIQREMTQSEALEVFRELYQLLEDYSPMWYPEELHDRAEAACEALTASLPHD